MRPTGTVTFMFTDIEDSTAIWEAHPSAMQVALARHDEILRKSVIDHDGHVFSTGGDGMAVVFSRAGDGVAAAIDAQRAMLRESWPAGVPMRVRMGLHTGEAEERDGDYFGQPVNRAARIMSAANAGHILISAFTAGIVGSVDGVEFIDLGVHRLRGMKDAIQVFGLGFDSDVERDGLGGDDADFRKSTPMRGVHPTLHRFPHPHGELIGRDAEIAWIVGRIEVTRLLTLVGPGGCGKTRLAQHTAMEAVQRDHGRNAWWVDLTSVSSGEHVVERVAATFGLIAHPGGNLQTEICAHLATMPAVFLIIDNAEHVIDATSRLVQDILETCGDVGVLVTSREPLGIPGETVWRVPSLSIPAQNEAVDAAALADYGSTRLFSERLRQARPELVIDDQAARVVSAICRRLDGIPLALELAAARVRTMSIDALAAALDDAFKVLTGGARTALQRQQTLRASIGWSVDLLDPIEHAVLRRLAVFEARFDVDAAELVTADASAVQARAVLDIVGRLVDKSLVVFDDTADTYRLLETIRQFAFECLVAAGEVDETQARHCEWVARWAEEVDTGHRGFGFDPSHEMVADTLTALNWGYVSAPTAVYRICRGLAWVRDEIGAYEEFDRLYRWIEAREDVEPDSEKWALAVAGLAPTAWTIGQFDYLELAARALPLLSSTDRASRRLFGFFTAGLEAVAGETLSLRQHLNTAENDGDALATIAIGGMVALIEALRGDLAASARAIEGVVATLRRGGAPFNATSAGFGYASHINHLTQSGQFKEAARSVRMSGRLNPTSAPAVASLAAELAWLSADDELLDICVDAIEGEISQIVIGPALFVRSLDAARRGDLALSIELAASSYDTYPTTRALASIPLRLLALRCLEANDLSELDERLEEFARDVDRLGRPPRPAAHLLQIEALLARADGRLDDMATLADQLLLLASATGLTLLAIDATELLGESSARRGDALRAAHLFGDAAANRDQLGYVTRMVPDHDAFDRMVDDSRASAQDA